MNKEQLKETLKSFHQELINLYGVYKISSIGILEVSQKNLEGLKINPQINQVIIRDEDFKYELRLTQEEFQKEISQKGEFTTKLSGVFLASIYQLWEDKFRKKIARGLGIEMNQVKSDLIGEIRLLRQAIIHNDFSPTKDLKKLKILDFIELRDLILLSRNDMSKIFLMLIEEIEQRIKEYCN